MRSPSTLRLLVTPEIAQQRIDDHIHRIRGLHPSHQGNVDVVVWDGGGTPSSHADQNTRLYAVPEVGSALTTSEASADWARLWRLITAKQSIQARESAATKALPLFVCTSGAPGIRPNAT